VGQIAGIHSIPNSSEMKTEEVMSNTEIVQQLYAAFGRGDMPAVLAGLADDVVWEFESSPVDSLGGIRHGKTETVGFFQAIGADHVNPQLTIAEFVASGDTVKTIGRYTATMKATGKKIDTPIAHYWKFRDDKVIRYVGFSNTALVVDALQQSSAAASH
jgi:ketosteroid isomerase-like protein